MLTKNKIDKTKFKEAVNAFRIDFKSVAGSSGMEKTGPQGEPGARNAAPGSFVPDNWLADSLPDFVVAHIGAFPENVSLWLTARKFTKAEKEAVKAFFDVDKESCKRRINLLERFIKTHFPDLAQKIFDIKDDPIFALILEMINPFQASMHALAHVKEQRAVKSYMESENRKADKAFQEQGVSHGS